MKTKHNKSYKNQAGEDDDMDGMEVGLGKQGWLDGPFQLGPVGREPRMKMFPFFAKSWSSFKFILSKLTDFDYLVSVAATFLLFLNFAIYLLCSYIVIILFEFVLVV